MKQLSTYLINGAIGVLSLIFFIALGLAIAIYMRPLYYIGMEQISIETGYSVETIKENYDALIDYCSPFFQDTLEFPTLPSSPTGISHFEEVKVIFNLFFILLVVTPFFLVGLIWIQKRRNSYSYLLSTPIIMCILPTFIGVACAIDFNRTFILFHEIVFRNDDWIFYPHEDPIILFLPERFFLQCALIIVTTVLLGCSSFIIQYIYTIHKKNNTAS